MLLTYKLANYEAPLTNTTGGSFFFLYFVSFIFIFYHILYSSFYFTTYIHCMHWVRDAWLGPNDDLLFVWAIVSLLPGLFYRYIFKIFFVVC
jgi:hypothetical protein